MPPTRTSTGARPGAGWWRSRSCSRRWPPSRGEAGADLPGAAARYSSAVLTGRASLSIGVALVTVAGINAAGLWSITGARRAVAGEASRLFRADTEAAARALDGVLAGMRADLLFLGRLP